MSLETILLIGILTIDAIALGVDCLWSLSIRFPWLNISDLNKETDANYFFEMIVNAQRQTNQFPIVILLIVLAGAIATPAEGIALNAIPNSHLESYLLKISLLSLTIVLSLILVEFI